MMERFVRFRLASGGRCYGAKVSLHAPSLPEKGHDEELLILVSHCNSFSHGPRLCSENGGKWRKERTYSLLAHLAFLKLLHT